MLVLKGPRFRKGQFAAKLLIAESTGCSQSLPCEIYIHNDSVNNFSDASRGIQVFI